MYVCMYVSLLSQTGKHAGNLRGPGFSNKPTTTGGGLTYTIPRAPYYYNYTILYPYYSGLPILFLGFRILRILYNAPQDPALTIEALIYETRLNMPRGSVKQGLDHSGLSVGWLLRHLVGWAEGYATVDDINPALPIVRNIP